MVPIKYIPNPRETGFTTMTQLRLDSGNSNEQFAGFGGFSHLAPDVTGRILLADNSTGTPARPGTVRADQSAPATGKQSAPVPAGQSADGSPAGGAKPEQMG